MFSMLFLQMSAYEHCERRPAGDTQRQDEGWSQPSRCRSNADRQNGKDTQSRLSRQTLKQK